MGHKLLQREGRCTNTQPIDVALRDIIFYTCKELRFQMDSLPMVTLALLVSNTLPLILQELNGGLPCISCTTRSIFYCCSPFGTSTSALLRLQAAWKGLVLLLGFSSHPLRVLLVAIHT